MLRASSWVSNKALVDAQKSLAPSNTPEQMLQATKNEVRKNRELGERENDFRVQWAAKKVAEHREDAWRPAHHPELASVSRATDDQYPEIGGPDGREA